LKECAYGNRPHTTEEPKCVIQAEIAINQDQDLLRQVFDNFVDSALQLKWAISLMLSTINNKIACFEHKPGMFHFIPLLLCKKLSRIKIRQSALRRPVHIDMQKLNHLQHFKQEWHFLCATAVCSAEHI
jgi:hypothetical protein